MADMATFRQRGGAWTINLDRVNSINVEDDVLCVSFGDNSESVVIERADDPVLISQVSAWQLEDGRFYTGVLSALFCLESVVRERVKADEGWATPEIVDALLALDDTRGEKKA